jgi:hypothetical protein
MFDHFFERAGPPSGSPCDRSVALIPIGDFPVLFMRIGRERKNSALERMFANFGATPFVQIIRKSCAMLASLAHAHSELVVPLKNLVAPGQRRFCNFADRYAVFPVRRADGNVARIAPQASGEFRIADRN